jgi:RNA polymerase sigma factor (sigma-70 family)
MSTDQPVTDLVTQARNGDKQAWGALVERYVPLIWSICRQHRFDDADADDIGQNVWLLLMDHLGNLRDPAALPGWLATTTRRECGRVLHAARGPLTAGHVPLKTLPGQQANTADLELLTAEHHAALRQALLELPPHCQQLIALLIADPPRPYAQISARLGIPVSSIGPARRRCLDKLRRDPAIAALINTEAGGACSATPDHAYGGNSTRPRRPRGRQRSGPAQRMPRQTAVRQDPPGRARDPGNQLE